jgi:hypothetical protein
MNNKSIWLAVCIAVLAIGLGLFALLRANSTGTIPASPPDETLMMINTATADIALTKPGTIPHEQATTVTYPPVEAMQSTPSTPTTIPAPPGVQACSVENLYASVDIDGGQGCVGLYCGTLILTNTGKTSCSVHGRPTMRYISLDGKDLPVSQFTLPLVSGNADSAVVLKPGGRAQLFFQRSTGGGCSAQERVSIPASWMIELPGIAGTLPVMGNSTFDLCRSSLPTVMSIGVSTFKLEK